MILELWTRFKYQGSIQTSAVISSGKKLLVSTKQGFVDVEEVHLLPPIKPSKIIGIGANYADSLDQNRPEFRFFLKPPSGLIAHKQAIVIPRDAEHVIVEPELAIIIGQSGKHISEEDAPAHILGYTLANDIAVLEQAKHNLVLAKCYDTFTPVGPWVVKTFNYFNGSIALSVNGEEKVYGNFKNMVLNPAQIIAKLSTLMTLEVGDLILTGTPKYFGPVQVNDLVSVSIPGIGSLDNVVKRQR